MVKLKAYTKLFPALFTQANCAGLLWGGGLWLQRRRRSLRWREFHCSGNDKWECKRERQDLLSSFWVSSWGGEHPKVLLQKLEGGIKSNEFTTMTRTLFSYVNYPLSKYQDISKWYQQVSGLGGFIFLLSSEGYSLKRASLLQRFQYFWSTSIC